MAIFTSFNSKPGSIRRGLAKATSPDRFLGRAILRARAALEILILALRDPGRESLRVLGLVWQVIPMYTMVSPTRLVNLYRVVQSANKSGIAGDIVECGSWNGGSAAVMTAAWLSNSDWAQKRHLWLYDSFQGLPETSERDGDRDRHVFFEGWCRGDQTKVKLILTRMGLSSNQVSIVPGWFSDTLKDTAVKTIAVLHVDADVYDSVMEVLKTQYPKVSPGGTVVIDDYFRWEGCRKAVTDFLSERHIEVELKRIDKADQVYFKKP